MIEVQNIKKEFGNVTAVDGISFSAEKGQIFGLIGPNGAGKSTTIRMIMNILAPDSGKIMIENRKITLDDKSRIGYLPEERGLYKKTKVNEILNYFGGLKTDDKAKLQANIDQWLKKFDLMKWKDSPIEELSKGMAQKVQFIASVAHDPQIIFFDEPFSGLDPVSADLLRESIHDLGRQGKTVLFSTHIMDHAEKICHKIFLINKGKEVVSGTMDEVKSRYGQPTIQLEFDGDGSFIKELPMVAHAITYPRFMEVELTDGTTADELLSALIGKIKITRFEKMNPSLHKIFINLVGKQEDTDAQNA